MYDCSYTHFQSQRNKKNRKTLEMHVWLLVHAFPKPMAFIGSFLVVVVVCGCSGSGGSGGGNGGSVGGGSSGSGGGSGGSGGSGGIGGSSGGSGSSGGNGGGSGGGGGSSGGNGAAAAASGQSDGRIKKEHTWGSRHNASQAPTAAVVVNKKIE